MTKIKDFTSGVIPVESKNVCKGQIFRAQVNYYVSSQGTYIYQYKLRHLKKKSCVGCEWCHNLIDMLHEYLSEGDDPPIVPKDIKHGALYMLCVTNTNFEYPSRVLCDWDMAFEEIKEV